VPGYQGKVAVVTGAASGIGFAVAARAAAEGMTVVLADIDTGKQLLHLDRPNALLADVGGGFAAQEPPPAGLADQLVVVMA
jgi:NAD(P)-dependent dehydrogenase (short-subunit alcohol dehydrogenase family)